MENNFISIKNIPNTVTYSDGKDNFIAYNIELNFFIAWDNFGVVYLYDYEESEKLIDETLEYFENQYPYIDAERFTVEHMHNVVRIK